jgi:hypothetical protein
MRTIFFCPLGNFSEQILEKAIPWLSVLALKTKIEPPSELNLISLPAIGLPFSSVTLATMKAVLFPSAGKTSG